MFSFKTEGHMKVSHTRVRARIIESGAGTKEGAAYHPFTRTGKAMAGGFDCRPKFR